MMPCVMAKSLGGLLTLERKKGIGVSIMAKTGPHLGAVAETTQLSPIRTAISFGEGRSSVTNVLGSSVAKRHVFNAEYYRISKFYTLTNLRFLSPQEPLTVLLG
jgi:hypothetical protein